MENRTSFISIPGAIIIAGTIIAIALVYIFHPASNTTNPVTTPQIPQVSMKAVSSRDHILGNPNAPIKIVEYSDPSCPYCKLFNPTMDQVMSVYGPSGQVAWVYRSFPLNLESAGNNGSVLHPNASHEAEAFECAASIGGNEKFWAYEKQWFTVFPLQGATDRSVADDTKQLAQVAQDVGLNAQTFSDCLSSGQFKDTVQAEYIDGINAGVSGTPYSILITPSGTKIPLVGAVPFSTLKTTIDTLLTSGTSTTQSL